jgi:hypothetical protein
MPDPLFEVKKTFFDRKVVIDRVGEARARVLSKIGAFVQRRMQTLTSRHPNSRRSSADPGEPPLQHTGDINKRILFGLNAADTFVEIGPYKLNGKSSANILQVLEHGGEETLVSRGHRVQAHYRGNPFALPSLQKELDAGTIPEAWRGSVRGNV